jgi:hypothetical protein
MRRHNGSSMERDLTSKKRAGRRVREQLRAEARQIIRRNRGFFIRYVTGYFAATAAFVGLYVWWGYPRLAWFMGGFFIGFIPALVSYFLVSQGLAHRQMGGDAEVWTADELDALDRRIWRVFHDVPVRYGNVDHVAVGPGRLYAVETKWTSAGVRYLEDLAACAARQAERLGEELQRRGVGRPVVPLLVVWGPGIGQELGDKPRLIQGVRVVAGQHASTWLEKMREAANRLEIDLPAARAVESLIRDEGHQAVG